MNWNLTAVAFTIVALGVLAPFDIIPGAGFYAGAVMLAIGSTLFVWQFIERITLVRSLMNPPPSNPRSAEEKPLRTHAFLILLGLMVPVNGAAAQQVDAAPFTSQQREVIRRHILEERRPPISLPASFVPAVGAKVPEGVELFWMPPSEGLNRYRYVVLNHRALIVEHHDRRVIEVLELPGRK